MNIERKTKFASLFLAIALLMQGCSNTDAPNVTTNTPEPSEQASVITPTPEQRKQTQKTAELYTINKEASDHFDAEVTYYDLGAKEYTAQSGKKMPYRVRGVIGFPNGEGPFPLILITHGSHSNEDESLRFDTGFTYLVEKLAKNGYIAVSMDMSSAYIWKYGDNDDKEKSIHIADTQIQSLKAANEGKERGFGIDLKDKIDFEEVGLIGHSRGGDTIFDLALEQQNKDIEIEGILSIAPSMSSDLDMKELPDTSVSILVPEYDGDVMSLDGFAFQAILDRKIDELHTLTFLRRANHNYFNTNIKKNDAKMYRSQEYLKDQISKESQQSFLSNFAVDFFKSIYDEEDGTIYDENTAVPNQMYGLDVMVRSGSGEDINIIDIADSGSYHQEGITAKLVKDSWFYSEDEIIPDTITFGQESYKTKQLLSIAWEQNGQLTMLPKEKNFSSYDAISFQIITDAASELNAAYENQLFTVVLEDGKGNTSSITLPDKLNSLSKTPGELDKTSIEDKDYTFWKYASPILSTKLLLSEFDNINLNDIVSVSLKFDQTKSGEIYLESVLLQ